MSLPAPSPAALEALLDGNVRVTRRAEILNADGSLYFETPNVVEGQVTVDAGRDERRMFDMTIWVDPTSADDSLALRTAPGALWYDKIVVLYRGFVWSGGSYETPLGRFMIDDFEEPWFPNTITLSGRDLTKKMLKSEFGKSTSFTAGQGIDALITALAANAGITNVTLPWTPDNPPPQIEVARVFEPTDSRWSACKEICTSFGYEVFFDAYGYLVVREFADPATQGAVMTFKSGEEGNLTAFVKRSTDSRLYNHIKVRGEATSGTSVFAEAEITDTNSPLHRDRIGDRVYNYFSQFITTEEQAQTVANNFLLVHALEEFEVDLGGIVFPWLEAGEVIAAIDPDPYATDDPTHYLLHDIMIPLGLEPMEVNGRRVKIVS